MMLRPFAFLGHVPRTRQACRWRAKSVFGCAGLVLATALLCAPQATAQQVVPNADSDTVVLLVTDSLFESGLLQSLNEAVEKESGISMRLISSNVGEALSRARQGQADAVIADDYDAEQRIVTTGDAASRDDVMFGQLIVVGPESDPAGIAELASVIDALRLISRAEAPFVSRGDDSGVDRAERRYWEEAGLDPGEENNAWYLRTGADMRTTLAKAVSINAYAITDLASWLAFSARGSLRITVEGDPRMVHQYGVLQINPEKHPGVNADGASTLVEWLGSEATQARIVKFTIGDEVPFVPNFGQRPGSRKAKSVPLAKPERRRKP